jgi:hypothetical protein
MSLVGAPPSAVWLLLFAALIGLAAWSLRPVLVPGWVGASARLVEVVLAISLAIVLAEALGLIGLLRGAWLIAAAGALALGAWGLGRWRPRPASRVPGPRAAVWELAVAGVLGFLVIAIWMLGALRILDGGAMDFDTLWYHLPLAAGFFQSGSVTAIQHLDPITLARFYPADSELLHAVAMAIVHRDVASPLLNVGWLAVAMLAGWCLGRPFGAAPLSLLAVSVILGAHVLAVSQAGNATNDIVVTAALLSAAAILASAFGPERPAGAQGRAATPGAVLAAGLAAGIAAGTKLNLLVPVAVLTVGLVPIAARGTRRATLALWLGGVLATGVLWYLRNLFAAGNPLPWLHAIGPLNLPGPDNAQGLRPAFTVVHYLGDGDVWNSYFFPGLHVEFGDLWPATIGLAVVGMVAGIVRGAAPVVRVLGGCALAGAAVYLVTPLTAGGVEGHPVVFATNLRWLAPFLALGLALLPATPIAGDRWGRIAVALLLILPLAASLDLGTWGSDPNLLAAVLVAATLVACWAAVVALSRWGRAPLAVGGAIALAAIAAAAVYAPASRDYLDDRFQMVPVGSGLEPAFGWAKGVSGADIGLAGTTAAFSQYPFYGTDLSNSVTYPAVPGSHDSLGPIPSCRAWRAAIDAGRFDFLVTAPRFDPAHPDRPLPAPEGGWTRTSSGVGEVLRTGPVEVFRVVGPLDPTNCPRS